jgi:hypothetical protein
MITSGGTINARGPTLTEDGHHSMDPIVADSVTDQEVLAEVDVATVRSMIISSDQDVLIETNNGGAPDETMNLKAGVPYVWNTSSSEAFYFSIDITAFFITNSSGSTATVNFRILFDSTP